MGTLEPPQLPGAALRPSNALNAAPTKPPCRGKPRFVVREAKTRELRPCAQLLAGSFLDSDPLRSSNIYGILLSFVVEISLVQRMMQGAFDEGRGSARKKYQLLLVDHADHAPPSCRSDADRDAPLAVCELQKQGDLLHLSSLRVRPSSRRRGLARRLLGSAQRRARQWQCQAIQLDVYEDNLPALRLYKSMGFQQHGWTPVCELELEALLKGKPSERYRLTLEDMAEEAGFPGAFGVRESPTRSSWA
eukprot:s167_g33.t1